MMKRARTVSKSSESVAVHVANKDEPPKKIAKKRVKSVTQSPNPRSRSDSRSSPVPGNTIKFTAPLSATKLGSLPMYGEHLPEGGPTPIPKLAEKTCGNLRAIMGKLKESKMKCESETEYKQKGLINFVALKKLNRLSHMFCKDAREQTHEQKLGVDDLHLQLQNLMYEAMHLRKEITNCLEFKSQHEEIDLIGEEELLLSSASLDVFPSDDHQRMLKRLEWELAQRKLLAEQQHSLETKIVKEEVDIRSKEETLSNILPTLEGIRTATLPLQESLGIPLDKKREEQDMALLLPSSLYVFYMQAKSYSEVQDSCVAVSISGDMGEARSFQSNQLDNSDDESGDSDNEGGGKGRRKKRRKREKSSMEKKISKVHPLAIVCTINLKGVGSFQFTSSYLPHFSVVCASVCAVSMEGMSDDQVSTHLDKMSLLHCLLVDSDTGRTSPNSIVSFHIRKHGNEVFSSAVRTYGFPYKWVQNVCGISDSVEFPEGVCSQQQVDTSAESMELVINKLKGRFKAQVNLLVQIVSLSSDQCVLLEPGEDSRTSASKLVMWKQLPQAEVQGSLAEFVSQSIFSQQERVNRFYQGTFQQGKIHMKFVVCIGADYPHIPPTFAINVVEDAGERVEVEEIQIKSMEADVNLHFPLLEKSCDERGQYLLCRQLQRLQTCFENYMELRNSPVSSKVMSSKIRGRGRLLILTQE